jgi:hypothetical protein
MSDSKAKPQSPSSPSTISLDRVQPPSATAADGFQDEEVDVSEANPLVRNSARKLETQDRVIEEKQARADGVFMPSQAETEPDDLDLTVSGHRPRGDDAIRPGQVFSEESHIASAPTEGLERKRRASGE